MRNQYQNEQITRRTTSDEVFYRLHADIVNLRLEPGAKLSEAEIARQWGVSRQPVREAFMRLGDLNLLLIRPQKATQVKKISFRHILNTRFVRIAVEVEVVRRACNIATKKNLNLIEENLKRQKKAANSGDTDLFHELDYEFHKLVCIAAECEFAYETIEANKAHVDRLCLLALSDNDEMVDLYGDHAKIYEAMKKRNIDAAVKHTRLHLSRLDQTLAKASEKYCDYFEE